MNLFYLGIAIGISDRISTNTLLLNMAEAVSGAVDVDAIVDGENARSDFANMLLAKRASPEACAVRKICWFWTTLPDLDMHGKDSYRVVGRDGRILWRTSQTTIHPIDGRAGDISTLR